MDDRFKEDVIERFFEKIKGLILPSEGNNYRSRFIQSNILLYCVILLLTLKIATILFSINIPSNIFFADITKSTLENFINQARKSQGLQPLSENQALNKAAQLKAENMIQDQYFNHTSPSGTSPWFWFTKAGYNYKYAGENLAIGFYDSKEVYDAWMNSPSHRANIINPNYTEVGTAVLGGFGGDGNAIVVVQEFASPLPSKTAVVPPVNPAVQDVEPVVPSVNGEKIEPQNSLLAPKGNAANNLSSSLLNSVLYNHDNILQNMIYGIALVVTGILLILIFFSFKISFRKQLVYRSLLLVILLFVAALINKGFIISLIPHQISI